MEDQLGALGLVVNAIMLWNTRYMAVAQGELRQASEPALEEDVARLPSYCKRSPRANSDACVIRTAWRPTWNRSSCNPGC